MKGNAQANGRKRTAQGLTKAAARLARRVKAYDDLGSPPHTTKDGKHHRMVRPGSLSK